jgi:hypothetical protein
MGSTSPVEDEDASHHGLAVEDELGVAGAFVDSMRPPTPEEQGQA